MRKKFSPFFPVYTMCILDWLSKANITCPGRPTVYKKRPGINGRRWLTPQQLEQSNEQKKGFNNSLHYYTGCSNFKLNCITPIVYPDGVSTNRFVLYSRHCVAYLLRSNYGAVIIFWSVSNMSHINFLCTCDPTVCRISLKIFCAPNYLDVHHAREKYILNCLTHVCCWTFYLYFYVGYP